MIESLLTTTVLYGLTIQKSATGAKGMDSHAPITNAQGNSSNNPLKKHALQANYVHL